MITERRKMKRTEKENNDIQGESKIRRDECKRNIVKKLCKKNILFNQCLSPWRGLEVEFILIKI